MATYEGIETYICVLCQELFLDPVTLPCGHVACLLCLENTLNHNKYQCFLCRKSIQSWYRNARRRNCLVNENLKNEISEKFPELIEKRLNGHWIDDDILPAEAPKIVLSNPGEIKRDFESEIAKLRQEIESRQEKENKLSEDLIKQLELEELRRQLEEAEKLKKDEEIARELALQWNASQSLEPSSQVDTDLALAREIAGSQYASFSPKVNSLRKRTTKEHEGENIKRLKGEERTNPGLALMSNGYSGRESNIAIQIDSDEELAKKLAKNDVSPRWRSKLSPKLDKSKKKQPVSKYGPMDRFVETIRTSSK